MAAGRRVAQPQPSQNDSPSAVALPSGRVVVVASICFSSSWFWNPGPVFLQAVHIRAAAFFHAAVIFFGRSLTLCIYSPFFLFPGNNVRSSRIGSFPGNALHTKLLPSSLCIYVLKLEHGRHPPLLLLLPRWGTGLTGTSSSTNACVMHSSSSCRCRTGHKQVSSFMLSARLRHPHSARSMADAHHTSCFTSVHAIAKRRPASVLLEGHHHWPWTVIGSVTSVISIVPMPIADYGTLNGEL